MASSSTQLIPPDADDDIDPETIQSTADISLSLALNLVQSWMPPNASSSVDPAVLESRKKLEEYMRRPPRLGVGAPMPTAQTQAGGASSHHETQRLKNRLVGAGAARRKAEEGKINGVERSGGKRRPGESGSDEDESESRASAMKKGRTASAKPNGLSVFGTPAKSNSATQPKAKAKAPAEKSSSPALPGAPTNNLTLKVDDPKPTSPNEPEEPMGIHTLPNKLPLAAKIWPQMSHSGSPIGSDRSQTKRRKIAPMLPPPSPVPPAPNTPELTWSSLLPQLPPSQSGSTASVTSSASSRNVGSDKPGGEHTHQPGADSTAHLSHKEQKRLRRAARKETQRASEPDEPASEDAQPEGRPSESPDTLGAQPKTDALRIDEPAVGDSESGDESEVVSQIRENEKVSEEKAADKNDTVQTGGKRKRKRKAKQKPGPS